MFRRLFPILSCAVLLLLPLGVHAQEEAELSMAELQKMVINQQKMLDEQRQLIDQQTKDLKTQSEALGKLNSRLDQLSMSAGVEAPKMTPQEMELQDRLAAVEEQIQEPPDTPENVLTAGDFKGSISIPGTNMAGKVGGFVRLGMVLNMDPLGSTDRFIAASIPVDTTQEEDFTRGVTISAKRSRMNLDMRMESSVGQFRAFLEGDFAGDGGTDNYRLRHAYGQYNRYILGQTWSTLMDNAAIPEELDFEGLNAQINQRQPLLRFSKEIKGERMFAVGLEDPSPEITGGEGQSYAPDISLRLSKAGDRGHFQTGLVLRNIVGQVTNPDPEGDDEVSDLVKEYGWGLTASGGLRLRGRGDRDNLKFQVNFGQGLGRYINDLNSAGGKDAIFDPDGNLRVYPVFASYVAYQRWWRRNPLGLFRNLRSTLVVGWVDLKNFDFEPDDAYRQTLRTSLNLIWSPISAIDLGFEFLYGKRWVKNGDSSYARQVQGVATFRF